MLQCPVVPWRFARIESIAIFVACRDGALRRMIGKGEVIKGVYNAYTKPVSRTIAVGTLCYHQVGAPVNYQLFDLVFSRALVFLLPLVTDPLAREHEQFIFSHI